MTGNDFTDRRLIHRSIKRLGDYVDSQTRILWKCDNCGHQWMDKPCSVVDRGRGCCLCEGRLDLSRPAMLYFIQIDDLFKVGVTCRTVKERFQNETIKYEIIKEIQFDTWYEAIDSETAIKREFKSDLYNGPPIFKQIANTEIFIRNIFEDADRIKKALTC